MSIPEASTDRRSFNFAALALGTAVLFGFAVLPRLTRMQSALEGKPAPDFALQVVQNGAEGDRIRLSDLKGQPVLISFWASWCGPCKLEAPAIDRLARRMKKRGVQVLGVNTNDQLASAVAFARRRGLSYPILFDGNGAVGNSYGIQSLPTLVVVDKNGLVTAVRSGLTDESSIEALLVAAR